MFFLNAFPSSLNLLLHLFLIAFFRLAEPWNCKPSAPSLTCPRPHLQVLNLRILPKLRQGGLASEGADIGYLPANSRLHGFRAHTLGRRKNDMGELCCHST